MMSLTSFERLLREAIGLDVSSIGPAAIERAVAERQQACKLSDRHAYWDHVRASPSELQQLIDAVVIPETWFFRDTEAFAAFTNVALAEWLRNHSEGIFRVLSVPCASGEEPYSLAMALIDAGLSPRRFRIDAFDISERALEKARLAVYGKGSFRGRELQFRDRYFEQTAAGAQLVATVRAQVQFYQANLLSPSILQERNRYDVIFCRNLLIYFDRPTQDRAITALHHLLSPDGMLFVGASETGVVLAHDFESAKVPMAFAFRRAAPDEKRQPIDASPASSRAITRPGLAAAHSLPVTPFAAAGVAAALPPRHEAQTLTSTLRAAEGLANEGRFAEAARRCEEHIRSYGPSAGAYYLLGLVRDADGAPQVAEAYYRKALYLDPAHTEALAHLALLMETQGRQADARLLRDRIRRLVEKTT